MPRDNPVAAAARSYIDRGWHVVHIAYKTKKPTIDDWGIIRITHDKVDQFFPTARSNIGVGLGKRSGGLVDIDLDCPLAVAIAHEFLPPTRAIFGRATARRSHWLYTIPDTPGDDCAKGLEAFVDIKRERPQGEKATIIEFRHGGGGLQIQTVFPGSIHKDTSELIDGDETGEPATSDFTTLALAEKKIAAAVVLIRSFPATGGGRHEASLALGGFTKRLGWETEAIGHFVNLVAAYGGSDNPDGRAYDAIAAAEGLDRGVNVYGLPKMIEVFGEDATKKVAEFLG